MELKSAIIGTYGDFLHHAFLVEGDRELVTKELFECLAQGGIELEGNPDFLHMTFDVIGIDEGRRLREMQISKAFSGGKRIFAISATSFTAEAQNALLKVFEEPAPGVHFFVIVPSVDMLLPTLRSRFFIIEHESKYGTGISSNAQAFIAKNKSERLAVVKEIVALKDEDQAMAKKQARMLLDELERMFHRMLTSEDRGLRSNAVSALEEIERAKQYIGDRAPSIKLILEHLALILPKVEPLMLKE